MQWRTRAINDSATHRPSGLTLQQPTFLAFDTIYPCGSIPMEPQSLHDLEHIQHVSLSAEYAESRSH